ncbi:Antithrombin-III [Eumeta japonica]|uniref:Antithrombin-III n=1 Tax=Eumeta variegata TaxID=151549 RepID=A0A4C1Z0C8_EUMVA|nr:Antithrombin-III [Eumeta japonica]
MHESATFCYVILSLCAPLYGVNFDGINDFSFRLMENVAVTNENNFAISPLSIWNVYSLLAEGASGRTFEELTLQLNLPKDVAATQALHNSTGEILRNLNDVTLKKHSALFADCEIGIHKDFCETATLYDSEVFTVDAKNTTRLASDINYYVCVGTEGYIKDAVTAEMLNDVKLIMVDAMYFRANWTRPFDLARTKQEPFYDHRGRNIGSVNMMYQKASNTVAYVESLGAEILELPYGKEERFSMIILLPLQGSSMKRLLKNLSQHPYKEWSNELKSGDSLPEIECYVPRFKITSHIDLVQPLKYMGLYEIFDPQKCELPGISDNPLFVSQSFQKVELEVNEEGTKSAVATVVHLEDRILGQRFEVNRPFVYFIMEKKSNIMLFAGVYTEPSVI